jgi:hypothetical protein
MQIAAFEQVCAAHKDDVPRGQMLWQDGNWKPLAAYLQYQRDWFLHLNWKEWMERRQKVLDWFEAHGGRADEHGVPRAVDGSVPMEDPEVATFVGYLDEPPDTIRHRTEEPPTTGSIPAPPQHRRDAMHRAYGWNLAHNDMKNQAVDAAASQLADPYSFDHGKVRWSFSGHGDARQMRIHFGGQVSAQQRNRVQAAMNVQHGQGRITVEG